MVKNKWLTEKIVLVEKCTKQLAQTAERKQKYLSSQTQQDLCTVEIATKSIRNQDETTTKLVNQILIFKNKTNLILFF